MLGMATRAVRRKMGEAVLLIDSTSLHLAGVGAQWARLREQGDLPKDTPHRGLRARCFCGPITAATATTTIRYQRV
jgi:hypothetical protein